MRIDRNEQAAAAGQHFVLPIQDLGDVDVATSRNFLFTRFHSQRLVQRDGLQVIHRDFRCQGNHLPQFIHLAHGLVENGRDNAAVAVSWRAGIALAQTKTADEAIALFVVGEAQEHAFGIVLSAGKAVIFLETCVVGAVSGA